jgi:hypothetical protein
MQKIQPMGFLGRREAISAPIVGYTSDSKPIGTAKAGTHSADHRAGRIRPTPDRWPCVAEAPSTPARELIGSQ